ncbi:MAG TPA: phosphoenolpyruvate synthase regulatory protein, partial [Alphaproteobacteria bacterium]|nr:phosphoenolpyruvate synthase regulatory protein [Alphaproteobacteria bacterium]
LRTTPHTKSFCYRFILNTARHFFTAHRWPIIDVTRRSIEETAAAVLSLYRNRSEDG